MLAVICCHFNPCGYSRPVRNARRFLDHLLAFGNHDIPIVFIEAVFPGHEAMFPSQWPIVAGNDNIMWQKERMLNIAIGQLPDVVTKVAWIDADMIFQNQNWYQDTEKMLDDYPVVQMFEGVIDLDANDRFFRRLPSWGSFNESGGVPHHAYPRPGGAWAARREILVDGLYDVAVLGAGDALQLAAWAGLWDSPAIHFLPYRWRVHFLEWAASQYERVQGDIGCVSGDTIHLYHGSHKNRRYTQRGNILVANDYFPPEDVTIGTNGLLQWCSPKPRLHRDVRRYFTNRQEDA